MMSSNGRLAAMNLLVLGILSIIREIAQKVSDPPIKTRKLAENINQLDVILCNRLLTH